MEVPARSKKTSFAFALIGCGVILGVTTLFLYSLGGDQKLIIASLIILSISSVVIGSVLALSRVFDHLVQPIIEEVYEDIADDFEDLKAHRITDTHIMVIITLVIAVIFSFMVFIFHKLEATWGGIPVIIPTVLLIGIGAWNIVKTNWFRDQSTRTPLKIFFIPVVGMMLAMFLGITRTENIKQVSLSRQEPGQYNTIDPSWLFFIGDTSSSSDSSGSRGIDLTDCDGDGCGYILLVVALVVITLILVIGSAFIPHFWLLSGCLFGAIMVVIAVHDLRVRPQKKKGEHMVTNPGG